MGHLQTLDPPDFEPHQPDSMCSRAILLEAFLQFLLKDVWQHRLVAPPMFVLTRLVSHRMRVVCFYDRNMGGKRTHIGNMERGLWEQKELAETSFDASGSPIACNELESCVLLLEPMPWENDTNTLCVRAKKSMTRTPCSQNPFTCLPTQHGPDGCLGWRRTHL